MELLKHHKIRITLKSCQVCARWRPGAEESSCGLSECLQGNADANARIATALRLEPTIGEAMVTRCRGPERMKVAVVGDSHSAVWDAIADTMPWLDVARKTVGGMSAYGLTNKDSLTQVVFH